MGSGKTGGAGYQSIRGDPAPLKQNPSIPSLLPSFPPSVLSIRRRVARGERLPPSLVHSLGVGPRFRSGGWSPPGGPGLLPSPKQLPQHVLQDSPVLIVQHLLRGIDPNGDLEAGAATVIPAGVHHQCPAGGKCGVDRAAKALEIVGFASGEPQAVDRLPWSELHRKNAHPYQVRAVN